MMSLDCCCKGAHDLDDDDDDDNNNHARRGVRLRALGATCREHATCL